MYVIVYIEYNIYIDNDHPLLKRRIATYPI